DVDRAQAREGDRRDPPSPASARVRAVLRLLSRSARARRSEGSLSAVDCGTEKSGPLPEGGGPFLLRAVRVRRQAGALQSTDSVSRSLMSLSQIRTSTVRPPHSLPNVISVMVWAGEGSCLT